MLEMWHDCSCFLLLIVIVLGNQASTKIFQCPKLLRCIYKKYLACIISSISKSCVEPSFPQDYIRNTSSQSPITNLLGDNAFFCIGFLL